MKFAVGYRLAEDEGEVFADVVRDYRDHIAEVYFAWPGEPSGRAPLPREAKGFVAEELAAIRRLGVKLDLLLNANCYGERALSRKFTEGLKARVGRLCEKIGLDTVTTASPLVARTVRRAFPSLDVRASVNMRLGTVRALSYVADDFTSYCIHREFNRDPERLADLQAWADANGKRLWVLANSGCLNHCSAQTFHDNIVAHEAEVNRHDNVAGMTTLCREVLARPEGRVNFLQGSWIRPEDIAAHATLFHGGYKLATRQHDRPRLVIDAYARGRFTGNLLDLMEPGFGPLFHPWIIDNTLFPSDWFEHTLRCDKRCERCSYCPGVLTAVSQHISGD